MKSYTDLEQSKKLAKILPIESADFMWEYEPDKETYWDKPTMIPIDSYIFVNDIPCWSLAALLGVYPMLVGRDLDMFCCWQNSKNLHSRHYDNAVDACVEMILKLHERNLL